MSGAQAFPSPPGLPSAASGTLYTVAFRSDNLDPATIIRSIDGSVVTEKTLEDVVNAAFRTPTNYILPNATLTGMGGVKQAVNVLPAATASGTTADTMDAAINAVGGVVNKLIEALQGSGVLSTK